MRRRGEGSGWRFSKRSSMSHLTAMCIAFPPRPPTRQLISRQSMPKLPAMLEAKEIMRGSVYGKGLP
eukprot:3454157-Pyramimonas_sp.AAC.1